MARKAREIRGSDEQRDFCGGRSLGTTPSFSRARRSKHWCSRCAEREKDLRAFERGDGAVRGAHEAVMDVARVDVNSHNRSPWVDGRALSALKCSFTRAWSIERGDDAGRASHEAVNYVARVSVPSLDGPPRVDAHGRGTLEQACSRARSIELGDGAVRGAHKAVSYVARVLVPSSNHTCRVDVIGDGALQETRASAGSVEGGDSAIASTHKAVNYEGRIVETARVVDARDCPCRVGLGRRRLVGYPFDKGDLLRCRPLRALETHVEEIRS